MSAVDNDLLDERRYECAPLGQFAVLQEFAQILGERGYPFDIAQNRSAVRQRRLGFALRVQKPLLAVSKVLYSWREVRDFKVGILDCGVEPPEPSAHVLDPGSNRLQLFAVLARRTVHLLFDQFGEVPDVSLGQHVALHLPDDEVLEPSGVEPRRAASRAAALELGLADVVGELPALGALAGEGAPAAPAFDQAAEQVCARDALGMYLRWSLGTHNFADAAELRLRHEGGECVLHRHRFRFALVGLSPHEGSGVGDVGEHLVDAGLGPLLAGGAGDAFGVERFHDV